MNGATEISRRLVGKSEEIHGCGPDLCGRPFIRDDKGSLPIHPRGTVKVSVGTLVVKCNRFPDDPTLLAGPYALRSSVSVADFRQFVSAMDGDAVAITNENISGLSLHCDEFGFTGLAAELSEFRRSAPFKKVPTMGDTEVYLRRLAFYGSSIAGMNLSEAFCDGPFAFTMNGARLGCEVMQAVALSPAVREQLSADACARSFALSGTGVLESLRCILSGHAVSNGGLL
jgi:hypothetical protein